MALSVHTQAIINKHGKDLACAAFRFFRLGRARLSFCIARRV